MNDDRPDVRRYVTDPDWGLFWTPAAEIPDDLRALADPSPVAAGRVLAALTAKLRQTNHDEDINFVAVAALAVPFLVRAATDPAVHHRAAILRLAAAAGHRPHRRHESRADLLRVANPPSHYNIDNMGFVVAPTIEAARRALAGHAPLLLGLLADPDAEIRCAAAYALATALPTVETAGLRARLDPSSPPASSSSAASPSPGASFSSSGEADPAVRISLVLAIAQVEAAETIYLSEPDSFIPVPRLPIDDPDTAAWAAGLWSATDGPDDLRLAGALAWLCVTSASPPEALLDTLVACTGPDAERWLRLVPWYSRSADPALGSGADEGPAVWLSALLGADFPARARLVTALSAHADPGIVMPACQAAYRLADDSRFERDRMIELLAERLSHRDPKVRRLAARLLTRCGEVSDPVADRVAACLTDPASRVWATIVLAHRGDARAAAPLAGLLDADADAASGFDSVTAALTEVAGYHACSARGRFDHDCAEHLLTRGLIGAMGEFSDELMPGILRRLTVPGDLRFDLIAGLAAWGDRAAPAVPALAGLLRADGTRGGRMTEDGTVGERIVVVETLGWIGASAVSALPDLESPDRHERWGIRRWARYRIAGGSFPDGIIRWDLVASAGPTAVGYREVLHAEIARWSATEAAVALQRCTGDSVASMPRLLRAVGVRDPADDYWSDDSGWPTSLWSSDESVQIVDCLGDIGPAAAEALPAIARVREHPSGPRYWRIGEDQQFQRACDRATDLITARTVHRP